MPDNADAYYLHPWLKEAEQRIEKLECVLKKYMDADLELLIAQHEDADLSTPLRNKMYARWEAEKVLARSLENRAEGDD
jgi:hypothetical protein